MPAGRERLGRALAGGVEQLHRGPAEEVRGLAVRFQQPSQAGGERRILIRERGEAAGAGRRRQLGELVEELFPTRAGGEGRARHQ